MDDRVITIEEKNPEAELHLRQYTQDVFFAFVSADDLREFMIHLVQSRGAFFVPLAAMQYREYGRQDLDFAWDTLYAARDVFRQTLQSACQQQNLASEWVDRLDAWKHNPNVRHFPRIYDPESDRYLKLYGAVATDDTSELLSLLTETLEELLTNTETWRIRRCRTCTGYFRASRKNHVYCTPRCRTLAARGRAASRRRAGEGPQPTNDDPRGG